jgi:hypothetical protein
MRTKKTEAHHQNVQNSMSLTFIKNTSWILIVPYKRINKWKSMKTITSLNTQKKITQITSHPSFKEKIQILNSLKINFTLKHKTSPKKPKSIEKSVNSP